MLLVPQSPQSVSKTVFWSPHLGGRKQMSGKYRRESVQVTQTNLPPMGYHLELRILWNARPAAVMITAASSRAKS